ncbi:MAG: pyridoxamine 5'-phosphate oxidase family protein [Proteobacteria bacterium]|nr:pyridoxamine 5'-phosphate oxidase family protein [Pseudomonadota bacterium]
MNIRGPWALPDIEGYLDKTVLPLRLAATSENGWPMVVSLWFLYDGGALLCATKRSARIAESLISSPRCGFEIARETAPYFGIRGQGIASVSDDDAIATLNRLADRYLGHDQNHFRQWLMRTAEDEILIQIRPVAFQSWDYRKRMAA